MPVLHQIYSIYSFVFAEVALSTGAKIGLVMACVGILVLVIVVVFLVKRVKKEHKFRKSFRKNELYLFEKGNVGQINPDCTADEQAELLPYDAQWEVPREDIKIGEIHGFMFYFFYSFSSCTELAR